MKRDNWIKLSEQKPEDGQLCFVWIKKPSRQPNIQIAFFRVIRFRENSGPNGEMIEVYRNEIFETSHFEDREKVSYWQPMTLKKPKHK